jgi:hypothetical protein
MILIAGDSWGCGEWGKNICPETRHGCLSQYFREHNTQVINISRANANNLEIANTVECFLDNNKYLLSSVDRIFVFQSNWNRDWRFHNDFNLLDVDDLKLPYQQIKEKFIERFYIKLNQTAIRYSKEIEIIGGCADTMWFDDIKQDYVGIKITCQSMINLLVNNSHRIKNPVHSLWLHNNLSMDFINYCKSQFDKNNLNDLLDDIDLGMQRQKMIIKNTKYFSDDHVHATPAAYKLLYDFLNSP